MQNEKEKILMYGLTDTQEAWVQENFGKKNEIVKTDCFTDIIAIPAEMIVLNPEKATAAEQKQMNDVFQHDHFTLLLFTQTIDKEIMPDLKLWAYLDDYMKGAKIESNSFAYIKELCDAKLAAYFPAGVPGFAKDRYQQELQYIEECNGADALRLVYEFVAVAREQDAFIGTSFRNHNLFVRFLLANSPFDPLPAYRYCPHCGHGELIENITFGINAPAKNCPSCGKPLLARGYSLPPVFVWGVDDEKLPYDVRDEVFLCSSALRPLLTDKVKELYAGCQVVLALSNCYDETKELEYNGICVLPKGKGLEHDYPRFMVKDKNGEIGLDDYAVGVFENGIKKITLQEPSLEERQELPHYIDANFMQFAEEKLKTVTAEELIQTGLLNQEEIEALQAMPTATCFQLTECLAVAKDSFVIAETSLRKEDTDGQDTERGFYTRETMYERLLKLGYAEADAYKITSFVRKGKASTKSGRKKWLQMVKDFSLPEELVNYCQNCKYICNRGDVLQRLLLLAVCATDASKL